MQTIKVKSLGTFKIILAIRIEFTEKRVKRIDRKNFDKLSFPGDNSKSIYHCVNDF